MRIVSAATSLTVARRNGSAGCGPVTQWNLVCVCACVCVRTHRHVCPVAQSCWALYNPWTVARQSMEFSRREYWGGLPRPPPGGLPDPGVEPMSLVSSALVGGFFTISPHGKPQRNIVPPSKNEGHSSTCYNMDEPQGLLFSEISQSQKTEIPRSSGRLGPLS